MDFVTQQLVSLHNGSSKMQNLKTTIYLSHIALEGATCTHVLCSDE